MQSVMMQNAMWLAGIFGPFLFILGLWMLIYQENARKVVASMKATPATFYVGGVINLLIGLTILTQYNVWNWDLTLLLTLLGWVQFVRGLMMFFLPQLFVKMAFGSHTWMKVKGIIPLVWGFFLCWLAPWLH